MKYIHCLISLTLFLAGCQHLGIQPGPNELACVNIIDRNGFSETISNPDRIRRYASVDFLSPQSYQKVMRVYGSDKQGNVRACITSYHDNGQVKQCLDVVNNRASGAYREWYANGTQKMAAHVIGGTADLVTAAEQTWLFEGCNRVWDDQGRLEAEIEYSKGVLEGFSTYYHTNGGVWKKVPFCNNQIHGSFITYLDDGTLLSTAEYVNGFKHGATIRYWEDGAISSREDYVNGLLIAAKYFDLQGNTISEISDGCGSRALFGRAGVTEKQEYKNGIQEGSVQLLGANGRVASAFHVKGGLKHGEEIEYYETIAAGKAMVPKISVSWYEGKIQGTVRTWYPNGVQESQREMSGNKKNGLLTAWYKNGSLMMIEEYEMNTLVKGKYFKKGEKRPLTFVEGGSGTATLFDAEGNFIKKVSYLNGQPED